MYHIRNYVQPTSVARPAVVVLTPHCQQAGADHRFYLPTQRTPLPPLLSNPSHSAHLSRRRSLRLVVPVPHPVGELHLPPPLTWRYLPMPPLTQRPSHSSTSSWPDLPLFRRRSPPSPPLPAHRAPSPALPAQSSSSSSCPTRTTFLTSGT